MDDLAKRIQDYDPCTGKSLAKPTTTKWIASKWAFYLNKERERTHMDYLEYSRGYVERELCMRTNDKLFLHYLKEFGWQVKLKKFTIQFKYTGVKSDALQK